VRHKPVPALFFCNTLSRYWYAGNANGVLSIQNVPGSHRWATPCDTDGVAFCVKPIPVDVTDSRM
jgi:hypothetical protein